MLTDSVSLDQARWEQLVSALWWLRSQLEDPKAGGWNYLRAHMFTHMSNVDAGHPLGPQFLCTRAVPLSVWARLSFLTIWQLDSKQQCLESQVEAISFWWPSLESHIASLPAYSTSIVTKPPDSRGRGLSPHLSVAGDHVEWEINSKVAIFFFIEV